MEKKSFERAKEIVSGIRELENILQRKKNVKQIFKHSIELPMIHMEKEVFELIDKTIKKLEKEMEAL